MYNPDVKFIHYESYSQKEKYNEMSSRLYLQQRHGDAIINDPYFNPNFKRPSYCFNLEDSRHSVLAKNL